MAKSATELAKQAEELLQGGKLAEAARTFDDALRADPENVPALVGIGRISLMLGRFGDAGQALERALGVKPQDADALAFRGAVFEALGQPNKAVDHYRRA